MEQPVAQRIGSLDGVRGIAILLVLVYHFVEFAAEGRNPVAGEKLFGLVYIGWAGVDLFFVLSGFLITGILLDSREAPHYFRNFYARRTLRIFPLYYALLFALPALAFARRAITGHGNWTFPLVEPQYSPLWALLYMGNWLAGMTGGVGLLRPIGHTWSLCIEEQFYCVWPLCVRKLERRGLAVLCVCTVVTALVLRIAIPDADRHAAFTFTTSRMDTLATGALLAVLYRSPSRWSAVCRFAPVVGLVALMAVVGIWWSQGPSNVSRPMRTVGYSALALTAASLIACGLPGGVRWIQRALRSEFLGFFGKYSYCLYIVHFPILVLGTETAFFKAARAAVGSYTLWVAVVNAAFFAISIALALISWRFFEAPILSLKRYFEPTRISQARGAGA